jgi:hypothetical protein
MIRKSYTCTECGDEQFPHVEGGANTPNTLKLGCDRCGTAKTFSKTAGMPYTTFGMLTHQYTGQAAAVRGWGTHNLDYGKKGSDLIDGRAIEATQRFNNREIKTKK